jgi:hypothetical protein
MPTNHETALMFPIVFPEPEDVAELRRLFVESIETDTLDTAARRDGDRIRYGYPVAILVSRRP